MCSRIQSPTSYLTDLLEYYISSVAISTTTLSLVNEKNAELRRDQYASFVRRGGVAIDLQPILEKLTTFSIRDGDKRSPVIMDHEVAFALMTAVIPTRATVACGDVSNLVQLYAYRYGMTMVGREQQLNGAIYQDPVEFREDSHRYIWKYGAFSPVGIPLTITTNEDAMFGRFIRERLMLFTRARGVRYVGMGDEIESVNEAIRLGLLAKHLGDRSPPFGSQSQLTPLSLNLLKIDTYSVEDISRLRIANATPAVSLSRTLLYNGEFGKWGLHFLSGRRVIATSFEEGIKFEEWKDLRVAIAIPAGGGKSTMSRIFGALDVDDLVGRTQETRLKALRRAALSDPRVWKVHNQLFWGIVKDNYYGGVIFIHPGSSELPTMLGIKPEHVFHFKPSKALHSVAIGNREEMHKKLSELNLKDAKGPTYESFAHLEVMIEKLYIQLYGEDWRKMRISESDLTLASLQFPDYSFVGDKPIPESEASLFLSSKCKFASFEAPPSNDGYAFDWYYEPWRHDATVRLYTAGTLPTHRALPDLVTWRGFRTEENQREQERRIGELAIIRMNVLEYVPGGGELPVFLFSLTNVRNDRRQALQKLRELNSFIAVVITGRVAQHWKDGFYDGSFKDGIFIRGKDRKFSDYMIRPDHVKDICNLVTMQDLCVGLEFTEDMKRRYVHRLNGFEGRHPFMSLWGGLVKGVDLFNTDVQTWINSQTHCARLLSNEVRRIYGESLDRFRQIVFLNCFPDGVLVNSNSITGQAVIDGKLRTLAPSGHLINLLLYSSISHIDLKRYMNTIEWNVAQASGDPEALALFDKYNKLGLLAEKNANQRRMMWHGYWDYWMAVATTLQINKSLKLRFSPHMYGYVLKRLLAIKKKWKKFDGDGLEAAEFLATR